MREELLLEPLASASPSPENQTNFKVKAIVGQGQESVFFFFLKIFDLNIKMIKMTDEFALNEPRYSIRMPWSEP